jgi:hypothetical protein
MAHQEQGLAGFGANDATHKPVEVPDIPIEARRVGLLAVLRVAV